ncbi:hypothetical protein [Dongia rigui]|uniref:Uncharacterized protein n=1 Tax=Dongia rigui TaxID=940149 RepID=A0ABU5E129_9PROT|nr:hypothetical protein [Dongia rigui]MDY0873265.1 hypothetical protein [Dongia rigui]
MEKLGFDAELNRGFVASVLFHVGLFLVAWFGLPHLFEDDLIYEQDGIKGAIISELTKAPRVDKVSDKVPDKPKKQKVEQPKKDAKPAPVKENPKPAAAPPPPQVEEQAVVIPDQTKTEPDKKVEKKPDQKPKNQNKNKPDDTNKKKQKQQDEDFAKVLAGIAPDQAADAPPEEPTQKAAAAPTEETEGQRTALEGDVAVSATDAESISQQIGRNWRVDVGALPDPSQYMAFLRVTFDSAGNVLTVEFLEQNRMGDSRYRMVAESCRRAFFITKQIKAPSGKPLPPSIRFGCDPQYANGA